MEAKQKQIFKKLILTSTVIIVLGAVLYSKSGKAKAEYQAVNGRVDFIDSSFQNLKTKGHRFIHVEGEQRVFDIFVGKQTGDFSPEMEKIDDLKLGDAISVYHSDDTPFQKNKDLRVNRNVEFIDKDNKAYFIRGTKNKTGGLAFMGLGILMVAALLVLKALKKIS